MSVDARRLEVTANPTQQTMLPQRIDWGNDVG